MERSSVARALLTDPDMKTILLAVTAAVTLYAVPARADIYVIDDHQTRTPNVFLINPGDLIDGVISVEYERALNSFFGLEFGLGVGAFRGAFLSSDRTTVFAIAPEVGIRVHFIRDAPGGLWFGPAISAAYIAATSDGEVARAFGYGLTAAIGYNFFLGDHFALQLGVGGGFNDYGYGLEWSPHFRLGLGGRW